MSSYCWIILCYNKLPYIHVFTIDLMESQNRWQYLCNCLKRIGIQNFSRLMGHKFHSIMTPSFYSQCIELAKTILDVLYIYIYIYIERKKDIDYILISITLWPFNWYQSFFILWLRRSYMSGSIYMERNKSFKNTLFFWITKLQTFKYNFYLF